MKYALDKGAYAPISAHEDDAGYDLRTPIDCKVFPGRSIVIDTGVHMVIPKGHGGLLVSKSGLNVVNDITSTGLIDCGYTGSIRVKLYNHGDRTKVFHVGDKVSQIVILKIRKEETEEIVLEDLEQTERGTGGFGSTGR